MRMSILRRFVLHRWSSKIICAGLAILLYLLFRVNTQTEREITIPLEVITPRGLIVSSDYPRSINITLRGNENDVKGVLPDDIEAFINLLPYSEEGEYQRLIEIRKKGTALQPEALELRSRPRELSLTIEKQVMRSLVVRPELSGIPALGYSLTQSFISPSSVTVVGPQSQMANLTELTTEMIDLSGRLKNFTVTTRIVSPSPQIELPGGRIVEFRGVIDEVVIIRTIEDQELIVFDLPDGLRITEELPRVRLTLQGNQLAVEGVRPQDMTFFLDGSRISSPGSYTLPLAMDIPPGLAVLTLVPREVEIQVVQTRPDVSEENVPALTTPQNTRQISDTAQPFGTAGLPDYAPAIDAAEGNDQ